MRSTSGVLFAFVCGMAAFGVGEALALDGQQAPANSRPAMPFKSTRQAQQKGLDLLHSGDVESSIEALKFAADGGQAGAQWKLGKIFSSGEGVGRDDVKAYHYFSRIVDNFDEDETDQRDFAFVANAFVAVGVYSLTGIPNSNVKRDVNRALEMFQFAATTFGEPNAQFNLARLYLDGSGVAKDSTVAARWLAAAARKDHMESQALLGHLLFTGQGGVQRERARGLMWLTLARDAASSAKKDAWIIDYYQSAMEQANDRDREMALHMIDVRMKHAATPP